MNRTSTYQPALAWFAAIGAAWVFVLVMLGAFTTSIGAGMIFPDWPLSNGSLNPEGWLSDLAKFAEHSHRLSAAVMSTVAIVLAVWLWRTEERSWLRRLGWAAVALVLFQALVGGLRVLLDRQQVAMVDTSVGRLFAMLHAGLAQIYVCALFAIAAALSRSWVDGPAFGGGRRVRRLGVVCCLLLLAQLGIAAVMRHSFAGLAIPTFPLAPEGGLVPAFWNFKIGVHFAHRALAVVLTVALIWLAIAVWRDPLARFGQHLLAGLMLVLLSTQLALGAMVIWTARNPFYTTAHVLVGALTLAATFLLTWTAHRDELEIVRLRPVPAGDPAMQHASVSA
ncbi:MAG: cytochrome oxidase assembly protein [Verrucomicrobia bacterium RIFCSPLOWO2_12_FULL_64_8]|nr:MAG: cytochrome oxidase assembly protein [Verrucomicrobia bacterium RIFCSPLOWO2_12_FULL_64_8]